jgi:dihydrodipicolinate synthase/N-acetylneuraminate lyase
MKHILADLEREMKEAAKNLDFERAAELRDRFMNCADWLPMFPTLPLGSAQRCLPAKSI